MALRPCAPVARPLGVDTARLCRPGASLEAARRGASSAWHRWLTIRAPAEGGNRSASGFLSRWIKTRWPATLGGFGGAPPETRHRGGAGFGQARPRRSHRISTKALVRNHAARGLADPALGHPDPRLRSARWPRNPGARMHQVPRGPRPTPRSGDFFGGSLSRGLGGGWSIPRRGWPTPLGLCAGADARGIGGPASRGDRRSQGKCGGRNWPLTPVTRSQEVSSPGRRRRWRRVSRR